MLKYMFTLFATAMLISCATKSTEPSEATTAIASKAVFFKKIKTEPVFDQLKINSKVNIETGNFIPTLDATIYIENGQKVWMNMIAVILNVGRGIAIPDGIRGYEKWNKTYIESDFTYLNNLLHVNFIDFSSLQNLLLGRTFIPINEENYNFSSRADGYKLISAKTLKFGDQGNTAEYSVTADYSVDFDLMKITLKNQNTNEILEISYANWIGFENMRVPKNVKIMIKGSKTSRIFLENTKFESSKMETPYSVPDNYTKTEIK